MALFAICTFSPRVLDLRYTGGLCSRSEGEGSGGRVWKRRNDVCDFHAMFIRSANNINDDRLFKVSLWDCSEVGK